MSDSNVGDAIEFEGFRLEVDSYNLTCMKCWSDDTLIMQLSNSTLYQCCSCDNEVYMHHETKNGGLV